MNLTNYNIAASYCRRNGSKRGGVCILIRKWTESQEIVNIKQFAQDNVFECCATYLTSYNLYILCLYRTPDSNFYTFLSLLEEVLHKYTKNSRTRVILAGDFNINTLVLTKDSKYLIDIAKNFNLILPTCE